MAKKKNAPVLRAQGGGGEPETKTITKSYAVRDKWLDKAKDNLVEFKSVDGEISDLKVNGEPAGGGGGDLRTAQVTFINASEGPSSYDLLVPALNVVDLYIEVSHANFVPADDPHLRPTTIVLGTNGYYGTFDEFPSSAIATGGVRYDEGDVYITGDGTLTIS